LTPSGAVEGRFVLRALVDENDTADITVTGQVIPTGQPGPMSVETGETGITVFRNVPLGAGSFLNLFSRTQIPITSPGTPFGAGAGFEDQDIVELRAEILLTGTATIGTPFVLNLVMSADAPGSGSIDQGGSSTIDATGAFGVPQAGSPVFDLPPDFTASSPSLGIVNNVVVPEPAGDIGRAAALAALGHLRRRHRRSVCRRRAEDRPALR
jgi:hypothetical protein